MAFLLYLKGIQRRDPHSRTQVLSALGQPVLVHGARPSRHQVQQPCRGIFLPTCQVHDAGELVGPGGVGPGGATHAHQLPIPAPLRSERGHQMRPCRHGLIWDHTVFHVVASCRANLAIVAPSTRNCRITQRIARTPKRARGAHTRSSCSRNVTVWQVSSRHIHRRLCHRIRAGTPAQGASITSTTTRP